MLVNKGEDKKWKKKIKYRNSNHIISSSCCNSSRCNLYDYKNRKTKHKF